MQRTLAEMKTTAQDAANVRWWTQQYPWYGVGAAAVLGFVAATKVLPGGDHGAPPAAPVQSQPVAQSSWLAPLFDLVRSTLMSAVIGAIHTSDQPATSPRDEVSSR